LPSGKSTILSPGPGASTSKVRKLISSCYTNFSLCARTHHMLDDITLRLQALENEKEKLGLLVKTEGLEMEHDRSEDGNRKYQTCLVDAARIVSREGDKNVYIHKLLEEPCNENFSVVPIVGLGGVGETTPAKVLYGDKQVNDHLNSRRGFMFRMSGIASV
nr:NB-ARC domains-containing protein [Tanacetum cinerariifolium]